MSEAEFDVVKSSEDLGLPRFWEISVIPFVNSLCSGAWSVLFTKEMTLISQNRDMSTPSSELTTSNSASDTPQTYTFPKGYYQDNTGQVSREPFDVACARKRVTDFFDKYISWCGRDLPAARDVISMNFRRLEVEFREITLDLLDDWHTPTGWVFQ